MHRFDWSPKVVSPAVRAARVALLCLLSGIVHAQEETTQADFKPPELSEEQSQDFTQGLGDFVSSGDVESGPLGLQLEGDATIARMLKTGPWVRMHVELGRLEQASLELRFEMERIPAWRIVLSSAADGLTVTVFDTVTGDEGESQKTVRTRKYPQTTVEGFQLEYRNGLVLLTFQDHQFLAYINNGALPVERVSWKATAGAVTVRRVTSRWSIPEDREFTARERAKLDEADRANEDLFKVFNKGDVKEALRLAIISEQNRREVLGRFHQTYLVALGNLASLQERTGQLAEAESAYNLAVKAKEQTIGNRHPEYATTISNLAGLYKNTGRYGLCEPLMEEALRIRRDVYGPRHEECANTMANLATLYQSTGRFRQAAAAYRDAIEVWETLNLSTRQYTIALNNLGTLYKDLGDLPRSEVWSRRAAGLQLKIFGDKHPAYAHSLNSLAACLKGRGKYQEALASYRQAREIFERIAGHRHGGYIAASHNIGSLHLAMGAVDKAQAELEALLSIERKVLGTQHTFYASTLNLLGTCQLAQGQFEQAEESIRTAAEIDRLTLGDEHPLFHRKTRDLSWIYFDSGRYDEAVEAAFSAADGVRAHLQRTAVLQSERSQLSGQETYRGVLDNLISMGLERDVPATKLLETIWQWKGAVSLRQRAYRSVTRNADSKSLFDKLQKMSRQQAIHLKGRPAPVSPNASAADVREHQQLRAAWEAQMEQLTIQCEDLEAKLAELSGQYRLIRESPTVEELQTQLPAGAVYIDFFEYKHLKRTDGRLNSEQRYLAFVVPQTGSPQVIELGAAETLNTQVDSFLKALASSASEAERASRALRQRLWMPVESALGPEPPIVVISTDAGLGAVPWLAIAGRRPGTVLMEDYRLVSVPFVQLVLEFSDGADKSPEDRGLLVVGDIDYGPVVDSGWASLRGFLAEFEIISGIHGQRKVRRPSTRLSGSDATGAALLREAARHSVIHLITHGFFSVGAGSDELVDRWEPGLHSGLVMAGANASEPDQGTSLTASQIEAAALPFVDLVVLSACETGLGSVKGGEGMAGLRRAFHIAGARTVVASLWKVDDRATQQLMKRFYTNLWLKGQSKVDALRNAQLWMLKHPTELEALGVQEVVVRGTRRELRKPAMSTQQQQRAVRSDPYFWAAFQLSGDWN